MFPQVSKLAGMDANSEMPGQLHWEVGYFGKTQWRPELRTDGKDRSLPSKLQDDKSLQDEKGALDSEDADAVAHTPPDPLWPSGICSVIVHQVVNLELENVKGTSGSHKGREYEPAKPYGESTEEESKNLPTSYCTILYNDVLVYKTRAKAITSKPIFNAGTERFMRDWRSAVITVTVRDQRYREHDPILGVVPLKLSDILETSSQVTRWYPLDGGIGFGRIRISLLFRSTETKLPPNMLGWDVGTFEFVSERIITKGYNTTGKLKLRTGGSSGKISKAQCQATEDGEGVCWNMTRKDGKLPIVLPVKHRYRSPVVFEFRTNGYRGGSAYAQFWLQHLVDNEDTPIDIPIWTTKNGNRLTQNYVTEENLKAKEVPGLEDLREVGRLQFSGRFKPGTDESHRRFALDNTSRETFETWEACLSEGVRQPTVPKEVPERVQALHEESLTSGRDVLKNAPDEEKQKWLSKTGADWSGAFGHDPKAYADRQGRKIAEPGVDRPPHDPYDPSSDESDEDNDDTDSSSDLGISDATTGLGGQQRQQEQQQGSSSAKDGSAPDNSHSQANPDSNSISSSNSRPNAPTSSGAYSPDPSNLSKSTEKRKHRGPMQWKPVRNVAFAKHQAQFGLGKIKKGLSGDLSGREPGVETETGQ